jgi:hypothetical protein
MKKVRCCLKCDKSFVSDSKANRICEFCAVKNAKVAFPMVAMTEDVRVKIDATFKKRGIR